ncbi:phage terminase large subunit [Nocardiopsis synnemataformans]|uniref:phage terminase large subunit n=1 Tax=Nocardiopsis synnemataformans TaxID=61305 RepID=UPI003EBBE06B
MTTPTPAPTFGPIEIVDKDDIPPIGPSDQIVRYMPRGAARDLMYHRGTEVVIVGSAGTGKSLAACWKMHLTALTVPGFVGLMLRATHVSLTTTTLVTFQRKVAAEAMRDGVVTWYGGSAKDPAAFRYSNGSVIYVAGGDKPEKFLSLEVDRIFVDEATEISQDLHETLISRLRGPGECYKQIVLACNPSHDKHWIKVRADSGELAMLTSVHEDNPWLFDGQEWTEAGLEYLAKLDKLTGVRFLRLRKGIWAAAEGVIFEEFSVALHEIDRFDPPADWPLYVVVDFGFIHPFVAHFWRVDGDGRLYLQREIFYTQRLVVDHAKQIKQVIREIGVRPTAIVCDHQAENRASLAKALGRSTTPARKDVKPGIEAVQVRLRKQGDGRPRIFFMKQALVEKDPELVEVGAPTCTVEEIPAYIWKDNGKEEPVKKQDDGMDTMRYMTAELDLKSGPPKVAVPTGKRSSTGAGARPPGSPGGGGARINRRRGGR